MVIFDTQLIRKGTLIQQIRAQVIALVRHKTDIEQFADCISQLLLWLRGSEGVIVVISYIGFCIHNKHPLTPRDLWNLCLRAVPFQQPWPRLLPSTLSAHLALSQTTNTACLLSVSHDRIWLQAQAAQSHSPL